ncbi:MAG: cation diffusion facilitator family transporter [Chitinophagaceae bacterium]|nr:cation diffusion facilitator family transporter [Chitinophagaceae bacterium]
MEGYKQVIRVQKWIAMLGILLLAIKFYAWWLTGSVAILTDALESIVNVAAGLITLISLIIAAKPRDTSHPYGHGKAEFISAGIEGTLITIAGLVIFYQAGSRLFNPAEIRQLDIGMLWIGVTGLANLAAGIIAIKTGKKNKSAGITAGGKHLISDAISTAGLLAGLMLLYLTGLAWIDSVVAFIFGFVIIVTGYKIIRSSIAGIMDESDEPMLSELVALLNKNRSENWIDLHNLRVIKYGNSMHVDCHLTLPWYLNLLEAHSEVDKLESLIKESYGNSFEMFVHTDGCLQESCRICIKKYCDKRVFPFEKRTEWNLNNLFENRRHALQINITPG